MTFTDTEEGESNEKSAIMDKQRSDKFVPARQVD